MFEKASSTKYYRISKANCLSNKSLADCAVRPRKKMVNGSMMAENLKIKLSNGNTCYNVHLTVLDLPKKATACIQNTAIYK